MADKEDLELRLVTTLAPMLLTIAVFALSATAAITDASKTIVDELLSSLAAICIFAAALLVDSALDKWELGVRQRIYFLGNGYLAFCFVVGIMTAFVPILYEAKNAGSYAFGWWDLRFFVFGGAGIAVFSKMMINKDRGAWMAVMLGLFVLSFCIEVAARLYSDTG
jgi:hypothetical protein